MATPITPGPPGTPKTVLPICAKCNTIVHSETAPAFKCGFCHRKIHISCTPGKYTEFEIRRLQQSTTPFVYKCFVCNDKISKSNLKALMDTNNSATNIHAEQMQQLKQVYEQKAVEMLDKMAKAEEQIQILTRQVTLQTSGEPQSGRKRKNLDQLDDGELLGFGNNKEQIIELMKEAVSPFIIQMDFLAQRQDELNISIKELQTNIASIKNLPLQNQSIDFPVLQMPQKNIQNPQRQMKSKQPTASDNLSYAQAVANASTQIGAIKNLNIMGTKDEIAHITTALKKDNIFSTFAVKAVKSKGKANITIKCADPDSANAVSEQISKKYGKAIVVKDVNPTPPMIKITRIYSDEQHMELVMVQIIEQNPIFRDIPFKIEQTYTVTAFNGEPYRNIIISTDIKGHQKLLKQGKLIFNLSECRVYEYVNLLMCSKCLKYGHFARNCVFPPTCKKCTLNHSTNECKALAPIKNMKCSNCIAANKRGKTYAIRHRPTDERCESRLERLSALKELMLSKN